MKPWNSRNGDACVLVSSQAGIVPRVKLQKSLYLSESRSMEKSESGSSGLEGKLEVRKESSECRQASRSRAVKERQTLEWQGRKTWEAGLQVSTVESGVQRGTGGAGWKQVHVHCY